MHMRTRLRAASGPLLEIDIASPFGCPGQVPSQRLLLFASSFLDARLDRPATQSGCSRAHLRVKATCVTRIVGRDLTKPGEARVARVDDSAVRRNCSPVCGVFAPAAESGK